MRWYKLRSGVQLVACLLWANVRLVAGGFLAGLRPGGRAAGRAARRLGTALWFVTRTRGRVRAAGLVEACLASGVTRRALSTNPEAAFVLAAWLNDQQKHEEALAILAPFMTPTRRTAKLYGVRGMAYFGLGKFPEALADLTTCHELSPQAARDFLFNPHRAYLHGLAGDTAAARAAMADQVVPGHAGDVDEALGRFLAVRLAKLLPGARGTVGVIIGYFNNAVGHAILDPYHFIQLYQHRFDRLILLHAPDAHFTPPTRLASRVLDQYVEQSELCDPDVLHFAWQSLGELRHEGYTFLMHNYWSLNRMAFHARNSADHPMGRAREYFTVPPVMVTRAEAILRRNHIDLSRPLVVLHTREHGYHGLRGQSYRNTDVRNYVPALRLLVARGYQVVRIGDHKMYGVRGEVPGLLELPATDYYDPVLDPVLIARCEFMISCQSGPCSYARVFGKPNLVLNAVYHFTLLPEIRELLAFKTYRDAATGRALSVEEVFRAGAHLFNRTEHFEAAGIAVEDMTPEEITAAVEEMLDWRENPDRAETPAQAAFRALMWRFGAERAKTAAPGITPVDDYVGYALPECRVSDAVCRLRPGYLPLPDAPAEYVPRAA